MIVIPLLIESLTPRLQVVVAVVEHELILVSKTWGILNMGPAIAVYVFVKGRQDMSTPGMTSGGGASAAATMSMESKERTIVWNIVVGLLVWCE